MTSEIVIKACQYVLHHFARWLVPLNSGFQFSLNLHVGLGQWIKGHLQISFVYFNKINKFFLLIKMLKRKTEEKNKNYKKKKSIVIFFIYKCKNIHQNK